jgi:hypothetical protein
VIRPARHCYVRFGLAEKWDIHSRDDNFGVNVASFFRISIHKETINGSVLAIGNLFKDAEVLKAFQEVVAGLSVLVRGCWDKVNIPLPIREAGSWGHISQRTRERGSLRRRLLFLWTAPCGPFWVILEW